MAAGAGKSAMARQQAALSPGWWWNSNHVYVFLLLTGIVLSLASAAVLILGKKLLNEARLSRLPNWFRWLLAVPVGLGVSQIAEVIAKLLFTLPEIAVNHELIFHPYFNAVVWLAWEPILFLIIAAAVAPPTWRFFALVILAMLKVVVAAINARTDVLSYLAHPSEIVIDPVTGAPVWFEALANVLGALLICTLVALFWLARRTPLSARRALEKKVSGELPDNRSIHGSSSESARPVDSSAELPSSLQSGPARTQQREPKTDPVGTYTPSVAAHPNRSHDHNAADFHSLDELADAIDSVIETAKQRELPFCGNTAARVLIHYTSSDAWRDLKLDRPRDWLALVPSLVLRALWVVRLGYLRVHLDDLDASRGLTLEEQLQRASAWADLLLFLVDYLIESCGMSRESIDERVRRTDRAKYLALTVTVETIRDLAQRLADPDKIIAGQQHDMIERALHEIDTQLHEFRFAIGELVGE